MRVITPLIINDTNLTNSTVAEPDLTVGEALWVAATSYNIDDIVIRTTTHKKYINIQSGIDATLPEVDAALAAPTRWIEIGPTNKYAMFDTLRSTKTFAPSPLVIEITPDMRVDSIALGGLNNEIALTVNIEMTSGASVVYSHTENLDTRGVVNWFDYFYADFSSRENFVRFDLPPYTDGVLTITFTSTTGTVECGVLLVGKQTYLGSLGLGARISANNFSRIEREFDGTAILRQRQTKPKLTGQIFCDKSNVNKVLALKETLNAVPAFWSGLDDAYTDEYFNGLQIFGIYKLLDVDVAYPNQALIDIEIEEI